MSLFHKNKKNEAEQGGTAYFEGYGKTEPVFGGEDGLSFDTISKTAPAADGALTDPEEIERLKHTVSAYNLVSQSGEEVQPVVGWLVCTKGSNMGRSFPLFTGYNYIGRERGDLVIPGDRMISAERHMCIAYEPKSRTFHLTKENSQNLIYLNGQMVNASEQLQNYDEIETGKTTLLFMGFCGEKFGWE